jgi:outer membrane protein assembly factor BamB
MSRPVEATPGVPSARRPAGRPHGGAARTALCLVMIMAVAALMPPATGADPDAAPAEAWPMARGSLAGTGRSATRLAFPLAEAWRRDFGGTAFSAVPVVADGVIYLGDLDGTFRALDLITGDTRWTRRIEEAGFPSAAAVAADPALPLVVGDDLGMVRGLDRQTGEVVWEFATEGEISGGPTVLETAAEPAALIGSQDATLTCLDIATGAKRWQHAIADQIRCSPTVARTEAGDRIFLAGCDGRLHVIDAASGGEVAAVEIGGPTGTTPAVSGDRVLFGTEAGAFFAIDFLAPAVAWRRQPAAGGAAYRSSAAVAEGLAIVGTRGRAVEALAVADGERRWRHPMRGRVDASPAVVTATIGGTNPAPPAPPAPPARSVAIVADARGEIAALDVASGEAVWEFAAGGGFGAGAAVAAGRVVLASDDGTVWCFRSAQAAD